MENIQCSQKINGIPAGEESGGFRSMKFFAKTIDIYTEMMYGNSTKNYAICIIRPVRRMRYE